MRGLLTRWRQRRIENAEDALADATAEVGRLEGFQRSFGGRRRRIRAAERERDRAAKRLTRLRSEGEG